MIYKVFTYISVKDPQNPQERKYLKGIWKLELVDQFDATNYVFYAVMQHVAFILAKLKYHKQIVEFKREFVLIHDPFESTIPH
jgi:hypothetical protein